MADKPTTIDEYISNFPEDVQKILQKVRKTIHTAIPETEETMSYDMPTFTLNGKYVIYFAGWKNHVSVYPIPAGDEAFAARIEPYKSDKSTAKFPLNKPIPYDLIEEMAMFQLMEAAERA